MREIFLFYISYFVPGSMLIPIIAGLIFYKQIKTPLKTLLIFLGTSFFLNLVGIILAGRHINNLPVLHVYTITEVVTVMLYYLKAFDSKRAHNLAIAVIVIFPALCILNFIFLQSIYQFNTYTRPLGALIIIVFSGMYLANQHFFKRQDLITASGRMIASGFLIYFCSSLFQFIFSNMVSHSASREIKMLIWTLHATFVLIMYLIFLRAILHGRNER